MTPVVVPRPFVIITPLGLPLREEIQRRMQSINVEAVSQVIIPDWAVKSSAIYLKAFGEYHVTKAKVYEALWRMLSGDTNAECWFFRNRGDYHRFRNVKYELRHELEVSLEYRVPEICLAKLHPFHLPDPQDLTQEFLTVWRISNPHMA